MYSISDIYCFTSRNFRSQGTFVHGNESSKELSILRKFRLHNSNHSVLFVVDLTRVMWPAVRTAVKTTLITVPVTIAVLDVFGYVARVEGASMQVSPFSTELHAFPWVWVGRV